MIRAVLFAVAIFTAVDFARAEVKKADAKSCDWAFEVFKAKIGDNCQKDLLGKLKNDQDKIFAQRIFKNWQPLTGYDVQLDNGLIHISNTKEDDFLEIHWISIEPAIAVINGVVVTDDVKDESTYRRLERMLKKADETSVAMGWMTRRHALPMLLLATDAQAKGQVSVDDAAFIFTIDGHTGEAEKLVENGRVTSKGNITPHETNGFLQFFKSKKQIQCQDAKNANGRKTVGQVKETIGGREVTIEPVDGSRTKFIVNGYPNAGSHTLVDFEKGEGAADAYTQKIKPKFRYIMGKDGKKHRKKIRGGRTIYYAPCSGLYNANLNDSCANLWHEMADDPTFPEVKAALEKFSDDSNIRWGRDMRCDMIYKDAKDGMKLHECNEYFGRHFQKENRRFGEDQDANLAACPTADAKRCNDKFEDVDLEGQGPVEPGKERKFEIGGMQQYAVTWQKDHNLLSLKPEVICPALGLSEDEQKTRSVLPPCQKPPSNAGPQLKAYWKEMSKGSLNVYAKARGLEIRQELERKVLGAMVLGECCNSKACADKLESNTHIKLEGAKATQ